MRRTQHGVCQVIEAIFTEYGVPFELVTDPASIFKGHEFRQLLQTYGVDHHLSTPPSHAGTGVAERYIGLTRMALAIQILQHKHNWSQNLLAAQTILNNRVSEATGMTPYQLFFHRTYFYPSPPLLEDTSTATDDDLSKLHAVTPGLYLQLAMRGATRSVGQPWRTPSQGHQPRSSVATCTSPKTAEREAGPEQKHHETTSSGHVGGTPIRLQDRQERKHSLPRMFFKVKSVVQGLHFLVDRHRHPYSHGVRRDRTREVPQEVVFKQIEVEQVHAVEDDGSITFYVVDYRNDDGELQWVSIRKIEVANRSCLLEQADKVL